MDNKCGIARVIINKIKSKFTCLISDKNCQLLEKFSEQAINPRDEMLVEKILENGNKLWVDFATKSSIDEKNICNTTYKNTEVYNLEMRKFTFSSLGESLLAIYNSNSISKTREANIKITKEGFAGVPVTGIRYRKSTGNDTENR